MPTNHRGNEISDNHSNKKRIPYDYDYRPAQDYKYSDYEPERLIDVRGKLRGERLG